MKSTILALILTTLMAFKSVDDNTIIGQWQNQQGTRSIEFYPSGSETNGKIISDEDPTMVGKIVFTKLKYDGKTYQGACFLPKRNRTVQCTLKLTSPNTLAITGKFGMFSDTKIWKRK
ncbi:MAG: DUF2147 domain-containing protein [Bacteroidetes bacterium]|nr:DUF2147 domain-containing protein [Bacteroidota bacterium]